jgi:hypothetical protein
MGLGILYKISDDYKYLPAFTRVFASEAGEDAENSLNTELGFRFDKGALHGSHRVLQQFLCQGSDYVWRWLEQVIYLMLVQPQ